MIVAPMLEQRDTMVALGWTVVSDYGYSHRSGWTIGVCRVRDKWVVELWDGTSLHANVDSPVAAARLHRELVAVTDSDTRGDVDDQHEMSN
ncbi:hypothetical protein G3O00_26770 [Burkholderia sp. Ac-20384]|uniref:hypothetical protein n=1 Tax=Burkholderia sp. Ac-20384 TaxID=2703902 RepID=UPI00197F16D7|nr:hypothetical protein [Burkholderia sp. Ac-20384]MBN3827206.1 hypothetical protein [Burkholderia sp. Ac-20384]